MEMKAKHKLSDASFDDMMAFWHNRLPEGNTCPTSIVDAKKIVCPLVLPHVRYHVCINDCIIYRGGDAKKTTCPVCGVSRYKKGKKAPRKVVWYNKRNIRIGASTDGLNPFGSQSNTHNT